MATPVLHQLRSRCQLMPASCSTAQMVYVLTLGKPSGARRNARCKVVSDQVAVPSRSRSGGRRNSARIRSRSAGPYWVGGRPPGWRSTAARPTWLKRATHAATESPNARPTRSAASVYEAPSLTASRARARATDNAGALWLRANCPSARRSEFVNGRSGSFFGRLTTALLGSVLRLPRRFTGFRTALASPVSSDPLVGHAPNSRSWSLSRILCREGRPHAYPTARAVAPHDQGGAGGIAANCQRQQ